MVKSAKEHTPGFVSRPAVAGPNDTVAALLEQKERRGFSSVCVTDTGAKARPPGGQQPREAGGCRRRRRQPAASPAVQRRRPRRRAAGRARRAARSPPSPPPVAASQASWAASCWAS